MLNGMIAAAREAGALMLSRSDALVHAKAGHFNYVTEADLAVQDLLKKRLSALVPGSAFFAEEQENNALGDEPTWIVDPIDGTLNFIRNRRASAICICLLQNKTPQAAIIFNPYADELFHAARGSGAFCNEVPIYASEKPFEQALVGLGTAPYRADLAQPGLTAAFRFLHNAGDLRRSGSAAIDLADVACGRLDVMFELELSPWDVAAGALLVTEAGGIFDMPWQAGVSFAAPACVLAASRRCYPQAVEILREAQQIHTTL